MKPDTRRVFLAAVIPLFVLFILYLLEFLEIGMDWDFTHLGVYPRAKRGVFGIFAHPLVHSSFRHLLANTVPLFFLSWCLFYFYREIAPYIFFALWIGCGVITFIIGKPGWHIGASGLIYGLAFFLFFSGLLRAFGDFPLRWFGVEYVPAICQSHDFMGRAFGRSYCRHALCRWLYALWPATS